MITKKQVAKAERNREWSGDALSRRPDFVIIVTHRHDDFCTEIREITRPQEIAPELIIEALEYAIMMIKQDAIEKATSDG